MASIVLRTNSGPVLVLVPATALPVPVPGRFPSVGQVVTGGDDTMLLRSHSTLHSEQVPRSPHLWKALEVAAVAHAMQNGG